jgi:hypothetical protein
VATEVARDSSAGATSPDNIWGNPVLVEQSPPVRVGDEYLAAAGFSFDPGDHPLQILAYQKSQWSVLDALPAPTSPGTIYHAAALDLIAEEAPVAVTRLTFQRDPDFLIQFAAAGCTTGALVSNAGAPTRWRYVAFTGPFPAGEVLGGDPRVDQGTLVSDNNCAATTPIAQRRTWTWTYIAHSATMLGSAHPGWLVPANGTSPN